MARRRASDYDQKRSAIRAGRPAFRGSRLRRQLARGCREALRMTKPALYHYFTSKDALLYEILDVHIGRLRRMVFEAELETRGWGTRAPPAYIIRQLLFAYRDADNEHKVQLNELARLPDPQRGAIGTWSGTVKVTRGRAAPVNPQPGKHANSAEAGRHLASGSSTGFTRGSGRMVQ